ncbi:hypothetical protein CEXT_482911 [Caerostris extrusa]|uniref:Uncharacterized protein n=1 Tax=Caerostris extrusa TaxID=172846 RepID=A0AAV4RY50_CAEEX|nr:hypothetical protein CEXT_482911 [Caerostris extrusa]
MFAYPWANGIFSKEEKRSADYPCFSGPLLFIRDICCLSSGKWNLQQGRKRGQQITPVSVETIVDGFEDGRDSETASGCLRAHD